VTAPRTPRIPEAPDVRDARDEPRDATRGGVNGPALPGQSPIGGKISPLLIDEPPPFWGRWRPIYLLIAGLLLAETGVFWALTRWAS